jgi:hypothetical protein
VALLLACALGVQVLLTGMALASAASSGEAGFSQGCVTTTSSQGPLLPRGQGHDHGLCCVLHSGLADLGAPISVGDRLTPPVEATLTASRENQVDAQAPPELAPLAPRAPPTLQI